MAAVMTEGFSYSGAKAEISIWNPYVEGDDEFSSAQIWLKNGHYNNFESIESGWIVNPAVYGDRSTRLFAYWTVEVLSCIRHPNMVLLLGACPEYGCLVYEFMDNGSLDDRIFRRGNTPTIPWTIRFKIAAEIATALSDKRQFSMYFYLPDTKDGLPALVEKLSQPAFINSHLPFQDVEVGEFKIPKFKFSFGFEASNVLKDLGLVLPFSGEGGGLSEMVNSVQGQNLYVSNIFHKSFVEVNEEGTEAAAASAGVVKLRALLIGGPIDFVADHPFMFLIREDMTGMVLFVDQVLNPAQVA